MARVILSGRNGQFIDAAGKPLSTAPTWRLLCDVQGKDATAFSDEAPVTLYGLPDYRLSNVGPRHSDRFRGDVVSRDGTSISATFVLADGLSVGKIEPQSSGEQLLAFIDAKITQRPAR